MNEASFNDISARVNNLLNHFKIGSRVLALMLKVSESTVRRARNGKGGYRLSELKRFDKLEKMVRETPNVFVPGGFGEWFRDPNECLGGLSPLDCILKFDEKGMDHVAGLLTGIKYGIPS
ncbi:DUF2384 domain-containing protein [Patescibacteria group bacterium]|nr:DUF2384 domain-containing protein [Patescibacteria group bacterium]